MLKNINLVFHRILSGLHLQPPRRKTLISMYLVLLFTPISFSYQPNVSHDNFPLISAELNWFDRPSNESKSGTSPWPQGTGAAQEEEQSQLWVFLDNLLCGITL